MLSRVLGQNNALGAQDVEAWLHARILLCSGSLSPGAVVGRIEKQGARDVVRKRNVGHTG